MWLFNNRQLTSASTNLGQSAADMRNKLIHGYDVIEYGIVFDTVKDDLPELVRQLQADFGI